MNVVELTKELVKIDSDISVGEKQVAMFIYDYLCELGIDAELVEFAANRADVVASIGAGDGLMINGHIDVVPIGDRSQWRHTPGSTDNGILYGRGTSDMKGGVACVLSALSKADLHKPKRRLLLVFVGGEETVFDGSYYLLEKKRALFDGVKQGIIAEPTDMKIQVAQKGIVEMAVAFTGKAAHGSRPWQGDSAILKATAFINEYMKYSKHFNVEDSLLGKGSVNIGMINGGTASNVVPDRCELKIDRRIVPGETPQLAVAQVRGVLEKLKIDAKIDLQIARNAFRLPDNSRVVKIIKSVAGAKTPLMGATGYTEAELYKTKANIDSVVFGPGVKEVIHQADEYIPVANLTRYSAMMEKLIKQWIG